MSRWYVSVFACALVGVAAAQLQGCSVESSVDSRTRLLRAWGEQVIMPGYADFKQRSGELRAAAEAFCASGGTASLESPREAWWEARRPWKRLEVLKFGPYIEFPDRWGSKIDFWPAREDKIEDLLAGSAPITAASLAKGGTLTRGLPVIEYLLYSTEAEAFAEDPRRCEMLLATTEDLETLAGQIYDAWDPEAGAYLTELTEAGLGSDTYPVVKAALGEVLNRFGHTVENIRVMKLQEPLGPSQQQANSSVLESRFSARSHEDIRDNLRGIETLYIGDGSPDTLDSVQDLLASYGVSLAGSFRELFDASIGAIDAIPEPLAGSLDEEREAVQNAMDVLGELQRFFQVDVLGVFSLDLSFNDADGD